MKKDYKFINTTSASIAEQLLLLMPPERAAEWLQQLRSAPTSDRLMARAVLALLEDQCLSHVWMILAEAEGCSIGATIMQCIKKALADGDLQEAAERTHLKIIASMITEEATDLTVQGPTNLYEVISKACEVNRVSIEELVDLGLRFGTSREFVSIKKLSDAKLSSVLQRQFEGRIVLTGDRVFEFSYGPTI